MGTPIDVMGSIWRSACLEPDSVTRAVCRLRSILMNTQVTPFYFTLETSVRCYLNCLEITYTLFHLCHL